MGRWGLRLGCIFLQAALFACSGGDGSGAEEGASEAVSVGNGSSRRGNFTTPNLSESEIADILGKYGSIDPDHTVAQNLLSDALVFYDVNKDQIQNQKTIAIVDFSLSSSERRFYLIDMESGSVTPHTVAHGSGSDQGGMAVRFSNENGSNESSLGFVLTGETYSGKHGRSLRLDGLSDTNSNMRSRAIVVHGADYVQEGGRAGRSNGCFAFDMSIKDEVIDTLEGGALIYANLGDANSTRPSGGDSPSDQDPNNPNSQDPNQNPNGGYSSGDQCPPGYTCR